MFLKTKLGSKGSHFLCILLLCVMSSLPNGIVFPLTSKRLVRRPVVFRRSIC